MKLKQRVVSGITVVATIFTTMTTMFNTANIPKVHASAQQRLETNIEFAKNKTFSDFGDTDLSEFTMEDLQMLGVFLSNFYSPYSTSIGKTSRDEDTEAMKEAMVDALSKQCNFDKEVAGTFVEYIWDMALSTAKPLYIGLEDDKYAVGDGGTVDDRYIGSALQGYKYYDSELITEIQDIDKALSPERTEDSISKKTLFYMDEKFDSDSTAERNSEGKVPANLYNLYNIACGTNNPEDGTGSNYTVSENVDMTPMYKHKDYSLYWDDNGTPKRVWTNTVGATLGGATKSANNSTYKSLKATASDTNQFTASTLAYGLLCDNLAYDYGIGSSLLSVDMDTFHTLSSDDKSKVDIMHAKLYVDCFGDIICDTGAMQVIIMPACINPYTWYNYNLGEKSAGKYYNLCNLFAIGEASAGHITLPSYKIAKSESEANIKSWKESMFVVYKTFANLYNYTTAISTDEADREEFYERCISDKGDYLVFSPLSDEELFGNPESISTGTPASDSTGEPATTSEQTSEGSSVKRRAGTLLSVINPRYSVYTGDQSLFNLDYYRRNFGETEINIDESWFKNNENTLALFNIIYRKVGASAVDYDYFKIGGGLKDRVCFPNWSTFCAFDGEDNKDWLKDDYTEIRNFVSANNTLAPQKGSDITKNAYYTGWCNQEYYWGAFNDIAVIDSIQAFESSDQSSAIKGTTIFGSDGELLGAEGIQYQDFSGIRSHNTFTKLSGASSKQYVLSIYLSYLYAFYDTNKGDERVVSFAFNKNGLPTAGGDIDWGDIEVTNNELATKVMSLALLWLHPAEGKNLIVNWIKNKVSSVLTNWHQDLVGKANATSSTGSTKYLGFTGYVTIPNLGDLEWLATAIDFYKEYVVYAVMLIIILMLVYTAVGMMSWQKATLSTLIFAVCAYLPPYLIDFTINTSNELCNKIYSEKFVYWALVQHEQYSTELNSAVATKDEWTYLNTIFTEQLQEQSDNYAIVSVKWQCPKKENVSAQVSKQVNDLTSNGAEESRLYSMVADTVNKQMSGEEFLDSANNQYLYRSYTDLGTYAKNLYQNGFVDVMYRVSATRMNETGSLIGNQQRIIPTYKQSAVFDTHIQPYLFVERMGAVGTREYNKYYTSDGTWGNGLYGAHSTDATSIRRNLTYAVRKGFSNDYGMKVTRDANWQYVTYIGSYGWHTEHQSSYGSLNSDADVYAYDHNRRILDFWSSPSVNAVFWDVFSKDSITEAEKSNLRKLGCYTNDLYGVPGEAFNTTLGAIMSGSVHTNRGSNEFEKITDGNGNLINNGSLNAENLINTSVNRSTGKTKETGLLDDADIATLIFAQYTESPFMYFSFNLQDQLGAFSEKRGVGATYKDLLLQKNNGYFYNTGTEHEESNNEIQSGGIDLMKDYMDLRSVFSIVIPYLKSLNDIVIEYDKTKGLTLYEDVTLEYDENGNVKLPDDLKAEINERAEKLGVLNNANATGNKLNDGSYLSMDKLQSILDGRLVSGIQLDFLGDYYNKYVHNAEVSQLLNVYTPWVDLMYEASYARPEKIYVNGKVFTVTDPLDPTSYYVLDNKNKIVQGREMVFSRSEMAYYGLDYTDLTGVEQRIIDTTDDVYGELLQIIDYHNFSEEVLNTAMAMLETFTFNKNFSDTSIGSKNITLYPQNFELKNFSYDAYLRLILAGTLNRDLTDIDAENIYLETIKNSGILMGILFLANDVLACVGIPALKLAFVIAIFVISILMILLATVRIDVPLHKVVTDSLIKPLISFIAFTVGFAFVVSLFMYEGNTAVTGRKTSIISMQSPLLVVFFMLVLNIFILIKYFGIAKNVFTDIKKYSTAVATSVGGAIGSLPNALATGLNLASSRKTRKTFDKGMKSLERAVRGSDGSGRGIGGGISRGEKSSGGASSDDSINSRKNNLPTANKNRKAESKPKSGDNKYNEKIKKSKLSATNLNNKLSDTIQTRRNNHTNAQLDLASKYEQLSKNEHLSEKKREKYAQKYEKQWNKALRTEAGNNEKNSRTSANAKSRNEIIENTKKKVSDTKAKAVAPISASVGVKKAQLDALKKSVSFKKQQ